MKGKLKRHRWNESKANVLSLQCKMLISRFLWNSWKLYTWISLISVDKRNVTACYIKMGRLAPCCQTECPNLALCEYSNKICEYTYKICVKIHTYYNCNVHYNKCTAHPCPKCIRSGGPWLLGIRLVQFSLALFFLPLIPFIVSSVQDFQGVSIDETRNDEE